MNSTLATAPAAHEGQIIAAEPDNFTMLDVYGQDGLAETQLRVDAIATISAGKRNDKGYPEASKKGEINIHDPEGRAPGLAEALQRGDGRALTIAFPWDKMSLFIQQRFTQYSQTRLLAYGDEKQITRMENRGKKDDKGQPMLEPVTYLAGTPQFAETVAQCKVSVSVYFHLAEWTPAGPAVVFPDGIGLYRLRFTSRNSLRAIVAQLQTIARNTGGRIAGLPFDLSLTYREVSDGTGAKRKICVWQIIVKPPQAIRLDSRSFRSVMEQCLNQGTSLMLEAPAAETYEMAALEGPDVDLDTQTLIANGGACDAEHWRRVWFATVAGTRFENADDRRQFVQQLTNQHCCGLGSFLKVATEVQANNLINEVKSVIAAEGEQQPEPTPEPSTPPTPVQPPRNGKSPSANGGAPKATAQSAAPRQFSSGAATPKEHAAQLAANFDEDANEAAFHSLVNDSQAPPEEQVALTGEVAESRMPSRDMQRTKGYQTFVKALSKAKLRWGAPDAIAAFERAMEATLAQLGTETIIVADRILEPYWEAAAAWIEDGSLKW